MNDNKKRHPVNPDAYFLFNRKFISLMRLLWVLQVQM